MARPICSIAKLWPKLNALGPFGAFRWSVSERERSAKECEARARGDPCLRPPAHSGRAVRRACGLADREPSKPISQAQTARLDSFSRLTEASKARAGSRRSGGERQEERRWHKEGGARSCLRPRWHLTMARPCTQVAGHVMVCPASACGVCEPGVQGWRLGLQACAGERCRAWRRYLCQPIWQRAASKKRACVQPEFRWPQHTANDTRSKNQRRRLPPLNECRQRARPSQRAPLERSLSARSRSQRTLPRSPCDLWVSPCCLRPLGFSWQSPPRGRRPPRPPAQITML